MGTALAALLLPFALAACEGCPGGAGSEPPAETSRPASEAEVDVPEDATREDAIRLAQEGRLAAADAVLLRLWREGDLSVGPVLGAVRGQRGDVEGVEALLAEARERGLAPEDRLGIASGAVNALPDPPAAAARLETRAATRVDPAQAALTAGLWDAAGRPRQAVVLWEVARNLWPDSPDVHRQLVGLYAVTGRPDDLVASLERLVALAPEDFSARVNLVSRLAARGDRDAAREAALPPETVGPVAERHRVAGDALLRAGLPEDALEHFGTALELDPALCGGAWGRARALLEAGRTEPALDALWALVRRPVGDAPCRVREATRFLLGESSDAEAARARLEQLAAEGGAADAEAVRAGLEAGAVTRTR